MYGRLPTSWRSRRCVKRLPPDKMKQPIGVNQWAVVSTPCIGRVDGPLNAFHRNTPFRSRLTVAGAPLASTCDAPRNRPIEPRGYGTMNVPGTPDRWVRANLLRPAPVNI